MIYCLTSFARWKLRVTVFLSTETVSETSLRTITSPPTRHKRFPDIKHLADQFLSTSTTSNPELSQTSSTMVPPPLRSILLRHDSYLVDGNVATADGDVCLICREPYSREGEVGCRASRIVHCGHIIGYQCLEDWIARRPDTCPYFNHYLPPSRIREARARDTSIDWIEEVLSYICDTTPWILFDDDFIAAIRYGARTSAEHALRALDQDRLTPAYARLHDVIVLRTSVVTSTQRVSS
jgi:hypothetical protein